jgi:hypothetical protein
LVRGSCACDRHSSIVLLVGDRRSRRLQRA